MSFAAVGARVVAAGVDDWLRRILLGDPLAVVRRTEFFDLLPRGGFGGRHVGVGAGLSCCLAPLGERSFSRGRLRIGPWSARMSRLIIVGDGDDETLAARVSRGDPCVLGNEQKSASQDYGEIMSSRISETHIYPNCDSGTVNRNQVGMLRKAVTVQSGYFDCVLIFPLVEN